MENRPVIGLLSEQAGEGVGGSQGENCLSQKLVVLVSFDP